MEKKDDSQNAMHAVKVGGNSMEPYFPDGSIAFCTKAPIENRDIGVFSIDGSSGSPLPKVTQPPKGGINRRRNIKWD